MTLNLTAQKRTVTGKKLFVLRQENKLPAVLYGHNIDNQNLTLDYNAFDKLFSQAGGSTLVDLSIDGGQPQKVLISQVQYEPTKHRFSHVDFHQVRMDEKINAKVALQFIGESRAVKEDGGVLVHGISEVEIQCLPAKLIHEIEVDVSVLNGFDDTVKIKDLKLPTGLEIIGHEPEDVVAMVSQPKAEEEEVKPETVASGAAETEEAKAGEAKREEDKEEKK